MMLSRVADSLYWTRRYLERAEHTARLVDVTLDLMPDRSQAANRRAWERTFSGLRLPVPDLEQLDAFELTRTLTLDTSNQGSIIAHITAARENARQVRELISPEMWEQINRLFLRVSRTNIKKIWRDQPHDFFQGVKEGIHLFQGISDSTMSHGEGWYFIQVGQFLERAGNVAALFSVYLPDDPGQGKAPHASNQYLDWVSLLRSCTAFEAYCKVYTAETRFEEIAEFLLLNPEFPHSVHFAINTVRAALNAIAEATDTAKHNVVNRRVGRLKAMLEYDQIDEVLASDMGAYLDNIQQQCAQIHNSIYNTYINYPASQKLVG
jgi:uncharacterized alpha-E superfamily protein